MEDSDIESEKSGSRPPREVEVRNWLRRGELNLPPASLRLIEDEPMDTAGPRPDGVLEARWQNAVNRFVFECKMLSTPKAVEAATAQAIRYGQETGLCPLVIVPYLSEERLRLLEEQAVSGLDLSGNGVLVGPGFFLWRSGSPNRFKDSQPIKNVYRGVSSIFARCFLLRDGFPSLNELREFALSRFPLDVSPSPEEGTRLVKSTASKVVQALEDEQIVSKEQDGLCLTDSRRLLSRLKESYNLPKRGGLEGKTALSREEIWGRLQGAASRSPFRSVTTGLGSAGRYGVLSGPESLSLYVTNLSEAADLLEVRATRVFPNVALFEEKSDLVYFDARRDGSALWASPIQAWLELARGGPREQDAAQTLETALIQGRGADLP